MIALVSFCLEMVLMFAKHHFLSMLTYLAILGIFLLNYFDMHYIKSCLIVAASSVLFDLIWIIAEADVPSILFRTTGTPSPPPNAQPFSPASSGSHIS